MIEIHVLGSPQVSVQGQAVKLQKKQLALLSYLTLGSKSGMHRRDTLVGLFWPEQSQSEARAALRQPLMAFRHKLGAEVVVARGHEEVGLDRSLLHCDAFAFDDAVRGGELSRAVSLYNGPLLDGLHLKGCREFEDWLDNERFPRARAFEEAVEKLAGEARGAGDERRSLELLRTLVFNDPGNERATVLLMESLEASGQRAEALRFGDRYIDLCRRDWAAEPGPRVLELLQRMRREPLAIATPKLPPATPSAEVNGPESLQAALRDRYQLVEKLGRSVLASVWLADDLKLRRRVAVKVLRPSLTTNLEDRTRFVREIQFLTRLNHPHIVTLLDAEEADEYLYYAMSYIKGPTLRDVICEKSHFEISEAVRVIEQVASALDYAHGHGVLHRDIKPENLLLHEGEVLVGDFGVALAIGDAGGERLTKSGVIIGSPEYMAPEQAAGRDHDVRADVYALACVLYEMLTGGPVFTGATLDIVIRRRQFSDPPSPRFIRPEVSAGLESVVLCGLARDPGDRYATPGELAEAAAQNA